MNRILLTCILILLPLAAGRASDAADTLRTVDVDDIVIIAQPKENRSLRQLPTAASRLTQQDMRGKQITGIKSLTGVVPNLFIPDYGSRLTTAVYIRGVGSGLPLVKEYLSFKHGRITIEDNLKTGAVVTISISPEEEDRRPISQKKRGVIIPALTDREKDVLYLFMQEHTLRVTDIKDELGLSPSTVHRILGKLEEHGIVETVGKVRVLTDFGSQVADQLF